MLHRRPALRDATTASAVPVIERSTRMRSSKGFLGIAVVGVSAQPSARGEQRRRRLNCELREAAGGLGDGERKTKGCEDLPGDRNFRILQYLGPLENDVVCRF